MSENTKRTNAFRRRDNKYLQFMPLILLSPTAIQFDIIFSFFSSAQCQASHTPFIGDNYGHEFCFSGIVFLFFLFFFSLLCLGPLFYIQSVLYLTDLFNPDFWSWLLRFVYCTHARAARCILTLFIRVNSLINFNEFTCYCK